MAIEIVGSQKYFPSDSSNIRRSENTKPKKTQTVTMSTDRVDNEIETLKSKGLAIAKSINSYDDEETRILKRDQLKQIQDELRRKDNDIYRRQNSDISLGVDVEA